MKKSDIAYFNIQKCKYIQIFFIPLELLKRTVLALPFVVKDAYPIFKPFQNGLNTLKLNVFDIYIVAQICIINQG